MRLPSFLVLLNLLVVTVYAGPDDKWVYVGSTELQIDGIALLLAVGAFVWVYVMYRDTKQEIA